MRVVEDGDARGFPLEVASTPQSLSLLYFLFTFVVFSQAAVAVASTVANVALIIFIFVLEACTNASTPFAFMPTTHFSVVIC